MPASLSALRTRLALSASCCVIYATLCVGADTARAQVVSESIGDRIVRFYASESARSQALPSMALNGSWPVIGPAPAGYPITVNFSQNGSNYQTIIPIPAGTSLYGTGMVTGPLLRNGRGITCWNDDSYGYGDGDNQLYQSHPWVLAVRPDGSAFGVWADTTYRCDVDLTQPSTQGIRFNAGGRPYAVVAIDRDSPQEVMAALGQLTGTTPMPPRWALGYHQCRFSYWSDSYARSIANEFRSRQIPCDAIWFDIDYMNGYRCFTFNASNFPNPTQLNADLLAQGFHTVWMIDPGIKWESGYWVNDQGWIGDHWVKSADGVNNFTGNVWPGTCLFPDFTRSAARDWWASLYGPFMATGIGGVWNDMNEPALLNSSPNTMPDNAVHRGDTEFGGTLTHAKYHNVYGMLMARATREGMQAANPEKRPFVLSRANYLGGQRYAATWTGDNRATWYHFDLSVSMVLSLGLSGQPFSGPDLGGFINDSQGTGQLMARWIGVGAMMPFARAHSEGGPSREPWQFGSEIETSCRLAIERRYRLLPYIYSLFHEASVGGLPVMRPVFFADPTDAALRSEDDAFLLGSDLMVVPQLVQNRDHVSTLPQGRWLKFDFDDNADANLPELYLRGGSIVPSGPVVQYASQAPVDPLTLLIALDDTGTAQGQVYEDAGDGYGYASGQYLLTTYSAVRSDNNVTVSIASSEGQMTRSSRSLQVRVLLGCNRSVTATGTDGESITVALPETPAWCDDGRAIAADFTPSSVTVTQNNATGFGDNKSELDVMWVRPERAGLRIGIAGNLENNTNALALFFDTQAGGQNVLNTASAGSPPSGVVELNGLRFDAGFAPDYLLFINGNGDYLYADAFTLPADGSITKTYRGRSTYNNHDGKLVGGDNALGLSIALDNTNTAGVTGSDASAAASATKGFEILVPYAYIGLPETPAGSIKLVAFVTAPNGYVSNQWLPGLGGGRGNLGNSPDLTAVPGQQYATVAVQLPPDLDADGDVDAADLRAFADCARGPAVAYDPSPECQIFDIDSDVDVDQADFGALQRCLSGSGVLADPACLD